MSDVATTPAAAPWEKYGAPPPAAAVAGTGPWQKYGKPTGQPDRSAASPIAPPAVSKPNVDMKSVGLLTGKPAVIQDPDAPLPGVSEGRGLREGLAEYDRQSFGSVGKGAADIARGKFARGGHEIISGGMNATTPLLPLVAPAAPLATVRGLAGGAAGTYLGREGAKALGADEDQADLVGDVTGIAGGYGAAKAPIGKLARSAAVIAKPIGVTAEDLPVVGGFVKGAKAATKVPGKLSKIWAKPKTAAPIGSSSEAQPAAKTAEPLEPEYINSPPRALPAGKQIPRADAMPVGERAPEPAPAPYRKVGGIEPEDVGPPDPNVLAHRGGVRVARPSAGPQRLLSGEVEAAPIGDTEDLPAAEPRDFKPGVVTPKGQEYLGRLSKIAAKLPADGGELAADADTQQASTPAVASRPMRIGGKIASPDADLTPGIEEYLKQIARKRSSEPQPIQ